MTATTPLPALICPCGAAAPSSLPAPGKTPVRCARCATPLVQPGTVAPATLEVGLAAGVVTGAVAAAAWTVVARAAESGAPWFIAVAALAIGWAVRLGARARSTGLQWMALLAFALFVCGGEILLYRTTLAGRLVAMHAAEGAGDPEILGAEELAAMDFWKYLHIELEFAWWGAVALGAALAWRVPKATPAVAAFPDPSQVPEPVAADG